MEKRLKMNSPGKGLLEEMLRVFGVLDSELKA